MYVSYRMHRNGGRGFACRRTRGNPMDEFVGELFRRRRRPLFAITVSGVFGHE